MLGQSTLVRLRQVSKLWLGQVRVGQVRKGQARVGQKPIFEAPSYSRIMTFLGKNIEPFERSFSKKKKLLLIKIRIQLLGITVGGTRSRGGIGQRRALQLHPPILKTTCFSIYIEKHHSDYSYKKKLVHIYVIPNNCQLATTTYTSKTCFHTKYKVGKTNEIFVHK